MQYAETLQNETSQSLHNLIFCELDTKHVQRFGTQFGVNNRQKEKKTIGKMRHEITTMLLMVQGKPQIPKIV